MSEQQQPSGQIIDLDRLVKDFPTQAMPGGFWEELGRTVATFGFLEETLLRAYFAITGLREIPEGDPHGEGRKWRKEIDSAAASELGRLIKLYAQAVRASSKIKVENFDDLVDSLDTARVTRNVLCHGSWGPPDADGRSVPFFVDKKIRIFETAMDVPYLHQVRTHVVELACHVINTVIAMGHAFPGVATPQAAAQ